MRSARLMCRGLSTGAAVLAVCAVVPGLAAAEPPSVRVIAGERSVVAVTDSFCTPPSGGKPGSCQSFLFVAGPGFPPALAARPGSEIVIDTGAPATGVRVSVSRSGDRRALPVRRIDERRWAVSMPDANVSASINVDYADGATSSSFLALRRIVASSGGPTSVTAYEDVLVWSQRQPEAGAGSSQTARSSAYHLTALVDGAVRRLPVAPRTIPFDVNLGPDSRSRPVAVYSRCAREPDLTATEDPLSAPHPPYTRGRRCDLYRFDFATGRERKLSGASTDQASEVLPSIWKDEIAFARVYEQRDGLRGKVPYLYVRPLAGGRSDRQPGGARGTTGLPGPTSLDLYGRRLSFVWNYATEDGSVSEVRLDTIGRSHRLLDRTHQRGATFLSPQGIDGRVLYAAKDIAAEGGGGRVDRLFRWRLSTETLKVAGAPQQPTGVAAAGDPLFAASGNQSGTTAIIDVSDAGFFAE